MTELCNLPRLSADGARGLQWPLPLPNVGRWARAGTGTDGNGGKYVWLKKARNKNITMP